MAAAGKRTVGEILASSAPEIERRTGLSAADVATLRLACAQAVFKTSPKTALDLLVRPAHKDEDPLTHTAKLSAAALARVPHPRQAPPRWRTLHRHHRDCWRVWLRQDTAVPAAQHCRAAANRPGRARRLCVISRPLFAVTQCRRCVCQHRALVSGPQTAAAHSRVPAAISDARGLSTLPGRG